MTSFANTAYTHTDDTVLCEFWCILFYSFGHSFWNLYIVSESIISLLHIVDIQIGFNEFKFAIFQAVQSLDFPVACSVVYLVAEDHRLGLMGVCVKVVDVDRRVKI